MKEIILLVSTLITALFGSCFFIFVILFCFAAAKKRKNRKITRLIEVLDSPSEMSTSSKVDEIPKARSKSAKPKIGKIKITPSMDKFPLTTQENRIEEAKNIQNFELDSLNLKNITKEKEFLQDIKVFDLEDKTRTLRENIVQSENDSQKIEINEKKFNSENINEGFVDDQINVKEEEKVGKEKDFTITNNDEETKIEIKRKISAFTETDECIVRYLPCIKTDKQVQFDQEHELKQEPHFKQKIFKEELFPKRANIHLSPLKNMKSNYNRVKGYDPKNFVEKNIFTVTEISTVRNSTAKRLNKDKLSTKPQESNLKKSQFFH